MPEPITSPEQYHQAIATFDDDTMQKQIDRIPYNVNRAGKHYKKLLQQIRVNHNLKYNHEHTN